MARQHAQRVIAPGGRPARALRLMFLIFLPTPVLTYGDMHHTITVRELKETLMLLWIAIIIAVLWLLGLLSNIGGGLIHILLVIAVVVLILHFVRGRSRT